MSEGWLYLSFIKIYLNYPNDPLAPALSSSALFIFFHRTPKNTAAIATTPTYSTILRPGDLYPAII